MKGLLLVLLTVLLFSCNSKDKTDVSSVVLTKLDGKDYHWSISEKSSIRVFVFMSPECPLCINYTLTISKLQQKFEKNGVQFYAIFSGKYYSIEQIQLFIEKNKFTANTLLDPQNKFAELLKATITPEVVVLNSKCEKVYSGAIDDWVYATGKTRLTVTNKYLEKAISHTLVNEKSDPEKTEPFGCYIEL